MKKVNAYNKKAQEATEGKIPGSENELQAEEEKAQVTEEKAQVTEDHETQGEKLKKLEMERAQAQMLAEEEERARRPNRGDFGVRKMRLIADPLSDDGKFHEFLLRISTFVFIILEKGNKDSDLSFNAFIDEDEWENIESHEKRKCSLRPPVVKKTRRYSRMTLAADKKTSKGIGLKIQWGITME